MFRFLVFSDLHLHTWSYGASIVQGRNSRLLYQQLGLLDMYDYAYQNNIQDIIFCGDYFHTHSSVSAEVLHTVGELHSRRKDNLEVHILLMGNHDMGNKSGTISSLNILTNYFGTHVVCQDLHTHLYAGIPIRFIPYKDSKDELKRSIEATDPDVQFLFMHQGVSGIPINSTGFTINEILTPDMIPDHIMAAFSGHYHSHKKVSDRLWIPGSMQQLTWADIEEERGFLDVHLTDNSLTVKHIPSIGPKFKYKTDKDFLGDVKNCFVRIDCSPSTNVAAIKEEALKYSPFSLEIRVKNEEPEKVETPKSFSNIVDLFHEYVETSNLSPEFVKIGKEIINAPD